MRKGRVLIIDDDKSVRDSLGSLIEYCGFDVLTTDSALEFLEQLHVFSPSIVVVDLILPEKDGVKLISELSEINPHAQLILISGAGERVLSAAAYGAKERGLSVIGTLSKPFSMPELKRLLNLAIERYPHPSAKVINLAESDWMPNAEALQSAIEEKQIVVNFQAQIDANSHLVTGFECLARWHHPEHGAIAPEVFVAVAEQSLKIDELTFYIAEKALEWFCKLTDSDLGDPRYTLFCDPQYLTLAINISAKNLHDSEFPEQLLELCKKYDVNPERVVLEITESSAMYDRLISHEILTRLRLLNFGLSIDDFGTGYSSMLQLVKMPFTEMKIDRSFVISALESKESQEVIRSIIQLAKSLKMTTIAEGVESLETAELLQKFGCQRFQGYYFCRPLSEDKPLQWLINYYEQLEEKRLTALDRSGLLDGGKNERYDRIVHLASRVFSMPIVLFSLVAKDRQWFKAKVGMEGDSTERCVSFCTHTLTTPGELTINDARSDRRFANNPLVTGSPNIRFYSGKVVANASGQRYGTLCLIDPEARSFSPQESALHGFLTELLEYEVQCDPEAIYHTDTGLLNEREMQYRVERLVPKLSEFNIGLIFLTISLDDFDEVTDDLTKHEWKTVKNIIASSISGALRCSDWLGHVTTNQFGILLVDAQLEQVDELMERIYQQLSMRLQGQFGTDKNINKINYAAIRPALDTSYQDIILATERLLYRKKVLQLEAAEGKGGEK